MKNQFTPLPLHTVAAGSASAKPAPLNTQHLFPQGSRERTIVHGQVEYRLRITAQGKLILTK